MNLTEREAEYQLVIADQGAGFDPTEARQKDGIGLSSMEERVHFLNGNITIQSQLHAGTKVQVSLPIDGRRDQAVKPARFSKKLD